MLSDITFTIIIKIAKELSTKISKISKIYLRFITHYFHFLKENTNNYVIECLVKISHVNEDKTTKDYYNYLKDILLIKKRKLKNFC